MTQSGKAADLHRIVESTYLAHKKDIHDYASGHLNHDKLLKLPTEGQLTTRRSWRSLKEDKAKEISYGRIAETRSNADMILINNLGDMKNALLDFSVGTAGTLPKISPERIRKKSTLSKSSSKSIASSLHATKSEEKLEMSVLSEIAKLIGEQPNCFMPVSSTEKKKNEAPETVKTPRKKYVLPLRSKFSSVLTEELKLQELMLPAVDEAVRVPPSLKDPHPSIKHKVQEMTDKKFVTTHLAGITQKDRFSKLLDFDRNVLHRYETMEKNVRDGHRATQHLEQKLVRRLLDLNPQSNQGYSLNFERLQAYGEVWQDLCLDSAIFGPFLSEIKEEYDNYVSNLLDIMKATNHSELLMCLNATDGLSPYNEWDVEKKRIIVEDMEEEGRSSLLRNAELHRLIAREKEVIEEKRRQTEREEEENRRRLIPIKPMSKKVTAQQTMKPTSAKKEKNTKKHLQELRAEIWERLDEISNTQNKLKTEYTPKTLHRNVQHAVQDTENEMQKLMQQNEYFTKNMKIQEDSLESDLMKFDLLSKQGIDDLFYDLGIP